MMQQREYSYEELFGGGQSPAPAQAPPVADIDPDTDALVRTVWGEARNQDAPGRKAVASVIRNRARMTSRPVSDVVLEPGQFEPWGNPQTRAQLEALDPASPDYQAILADIQGDDDPTGGATHFYAPKAQEALGRDAPAWDDGTGVDIGDHRFFRLPYGGAEPAAGEQREFSYEELFGDVGAEVDEKPAIEIEVNRSTNPEFLAAQAERRAAKPVAAVTGFMANLNREIPLFDEIAAAGGVVADIARGKLRPSRDDAGKIAPPDVRAAFNERMARQRGLERDFAASNPTSASLAKGLGLAGAVALPGPKLAPLVSPSMAVNAARGAVTAGLTGAAFEAADDGTAQERLAAASSAARNPVILGLGAMGGAIATPRASPRTLPTSDELRLARDGAYRAVDDAGVRYTPEAYEELASTITSDLTRANLNPMRHPKAASMLDDINGLRGSSPTLTELDQLRQVIRRDVASPKLDDAEQFFGRRMIAQIDDFIAKADPAAVVAGGADDAARIMTDARGANTRYRKVQAVEDAVESAKLRAGSTGSGGNVDNATRQNLRRVLETTQNLTETERKALESIVLGGQGQNMLRLLGKLSPQGNGLMAALGIGGTMINPAVGALSLGGMAAKSTADALTQQKVAKLIQTMADGGDAGVRAQEQLIAYLASNPQAQAAYAGFVSRLSRAAGAGAVAGPGADAAQSLPAISSGPPALRAATQ